MTQESQQYTSELPAPLYRAEAVREIDRIAIHEAGIDGFELMSRAGGAAFDALRDRWPEARHLSIFCGTGNNGGDGYVMAALAEKAGLEAHCIQVGDSDKIQGDALTAWQHAKDAGASFEAFAPGFNCTADVVVDALLGTGLSGAAKGAQAEAIQVINDSGCPVLAVDIPSGLCADTGTCLGATVKAQVTVTFIGMKQGLLTGQAPDQVGELLFAGLEVPQSVLARVQASATLLNAGHVAHWLPPRSRLAHKGQNGHVLIIGGDAGMGGAAAMAAEAAGRVGAGLISVLTRPQHIAPILARRPECMVAAVDEGEDIRHWLERVDVVVAGPGIGQQPWGQSLLRQVLDCDCPLVLDADGLNLLAGWWQSGEKVVHRAPWVLTPHPGEATRLLGITTQALMADRFDSVQALQQKYGAAVVLKGAGSLVASAEGRLWVSHSGNPGMASGGMGDVLSGVIGGLIAQGLSPSDAAACGVWVHGAAGDRATEQSGQRGLLASDLMPHLRRLVNAT